MRTTNLVADPLKRLAAVFMGLLLGVFALDGCASRKPQLSASQFRFSYEDQAYRIRSISSADKTESYNELIGDDFLAADFDQDRIIDCIVLGEASLSAAQKVYEYGLDAVDKESRLQVRNPTVHRFVYEGNSLRLEVSSFRPANAQPFNQLKIINKRQIVSPRIIVAVDQNADGTLDEVLQGAASPEEAQSQYTEVLEAGLLKRELIKVNSTILVKPSPRE